MTIHYFHKDYLLNNTPSRADAISADTEQKYRKTNCKMISIAGKDLKLPQWTIARATIDCHRFYAVKSPSTNSRFLVSAACLFLAAKADDCPRALNDVLKVSWKTWNRNKPVEEQNKLLDPAHAAFLDELRNLTLDAERAILFSRAFDFDVPHAFHQLIAIFRKEGMFPPTSEQIWQKNLLQTSWNLVNDSLPTDLNLLYDPSLMAKAAIYVSCRIQKARIVPPNKTFAEHFNIDPAVLQEIGSQLVDLYNLQLDDYPELAGIAAAQPPALPAPALAVEEEDVPRLLVEDVPQPLADDVPKVLVKVEAASPEETGIRPEKKQEAAVSNGAASRKRRAEAAAQDAPAGKALKAGSS